MTTVTRREALRAALPADVDAILVTNPPNRRYLTGFTGSAGAVLLEADGRTLLATDGRYQEQAAAEAPDVELVDSRSPAVDLVRAAVGRGVRRIAVERHHVTLALADQLAAAGAELHDAGRPVEELRRVKDDEELAALGAACEATAGAFAAVVEWLRPGVTEREVAWQVSTRMRERGAEADAFPAIVAFGPHSAIPHHAPTDRPLARGDLVKLDIGARVAGYHADMTRTVVCGPAQPWQRDLHAEVLRIQAAGRDATRAGAVPVELDSLARQLVEATGHPVLHGLGHGVGLEIHEEPFLVPGSTGGPLQPGTAVTIEPGIYLPGRGGVRIEDSVVVTAAGNEPLTHADRELLEV